MELQQGASLLWEEPTLHFSLATLIFKTCRVTLNLHSGCRAFRVSHVSLQLMAFLTIALLAVTVNGKSIQITPGDSAISAIDTGTTLIGGPSADVAAIWAAVPGSAPATGENVGSYTFRACFPSLVWPFA